MNKTAAQLWLESKLKSPEFQEEYSKALAEIKDEQKAIRQLQRAEWMREAFEEYKASEVEKVWTELDGKDFAE